MRPCLPKFILPNQYDRPNKPIVASEKKVFAKHSGSGLSIPASIEESTKSHPLAIQKWHKHTGRLTAKAWILKRESSNVIFFGCFWGKAFASKLTNHNTLEKAVAMECDAIFCLYIHK